MNDSKIDKYLNLDKNLPRMRLVPTVFADSKGNYFETEARRSGNNKIERGIVWKNKQGSTVLESTDWLKKQVASYKKRYGRFELFIFLGTCDFGAKDTDGIIHLLPKSARIPDKILSKFRSFSHYARIKGFPVACLEVPAIRLQEWNHRHGHQNPQIFIDDDNSLNPMIETLNKKIRKLNRENGR